MNYRWDEYPKLTPAIRDGLEDYVERGVLPSHFLVAALRNDLADTFGRADWANKDRIGELVTWLYNVAPGKCWGSAAAVIRWTGHCGISGAPDIVPAFGYDDQPDQVINPDK